MNYRVLELDVKRVGELVTMRPHQAARDFRTGGRTSRAAVRLVMYRLRTQVERLGMFPVDAPDLHHGAPDDFMRNIRTIGATVRCIDRLEANVIDIHRLPDRIPPGTISLKIPYMPDWRGTTDSQ